MSLEAILHDQNPWWARPESGRDVQVTRRDAFREIHRHVLDSQAQRQLVLVGPRQVGKTVLLRQTAARLLDEGLPPGNLTYFDFSDDRLIEPPPHRDVAAYRPSGASTDAPRVLLLDEVGSGGGDWARWLKFAHDHAADTRDRYLVTDSAAQLLLRGGRESGQGRWDELVLETLTLAEYLRMRDVSEPLELAAAADSYLRAGGYPEHLFGPHLRDPGGERSVRRSLRDDISNRAVYRDLERTGVDVSRARQLFVALVQDSGGILSESGRAQDLGADRRSVAEWVRLLEDTMLVHRLSRWGPDTSTRLRGRPKLYALDHGVVAAFAPVADPMSDTRVRGQMYETAVFHHLRAEARARGLEPSAVTYFRGPRSQEVDFVWDDGARVLIEVTAGRPRAKKLAAVAALGRKLEAPRVALVHGGQDRGIERDVHLLPLVEFLRDPLGWSAE